MRELQERMDSREFAEWMAYNELDPFTRERADLRAGIIAQQIANANRGKGQRPFKPSDFMPEYGKAVKPKRSADDEWMVLMSWVSKYNKARADKRGGS